MDRSKFRNVEASAAPKGLLNFEEWESRATLVCPNCGGAQTHAQQVYTVCSKDADEADDRHSFGCPFGGFDDTSERRTAVVILFECETCKPRFELIFQQHKGNTFVQTRVEREH